MAIASTSACAPTISLPRPAVALPQAFEVRSVAATTGELALDRWWQAFRDPQLSHLIDRALERSTTARLAVARIAEARAARGQARASTLPTGNLAANATEQGSERLTGSGIDRPGSESYQASFSPSWEIDLFGRLAAIRSRADLDYQVSALDFYAVRLALAADVAGALFQGRFVATQLADADDSLRILRELAASAALGRSRGLTSDQDLARLEADVASGEAEVARLTAELRASKRSLLILTGEPAASTEALPLQPSLAPPPQLPDLAPGVLLARRPDVRQAEVSLQSAARTIDIDRLALFPRLNIQPGVGLSAAAGASSGLWSLAAGVSAPVLDRARLVASLRVSEARGQQAVIGYERAVQTAFGEAENALTRVVGGEQRIGRLEQATSRARQAFDAARRGYAAGVTDLTTLLQSERTWLQNRSALQAGRFALLSDTVTAFRALGGGWDPAVSLAPEALSHPIEEAK
ncbi:MAG: TolC family protein [Rhizorhabdus sp.]